MGIGGVGVVEPLICALLVKRLPLISVAPAGIYAPDIPIRRRSADPSGAHFAKGDFQAITGGADFAR